MTTYYERNKEEIKLKARNYYRDNKDKIKERSRLYYKKNKNKLREKARVRYQELPEDAKMEKRRYGRERYTNKKQKTRESDTQTV